MKQWMILLLAVVLCCAGCQQTTPPPPTTDPIVPRATEAPAVSAPTPTAPATTPTEALSQESVYVYPQAIEDYLLPIEEFSWEREHVPQFVMLHFTSAVVNHRDDPFNMDHIRQIFIDYELSIHYIVQRDSTVRCYIPEDRVAWHAGKGQWADDPTYTDSMNHYAIGIEIVAIGSASDMSQYLTAAEYAQLDDSLKGFTQAQYDTLRALVTDLCQRYDIPMDRQHVLGHDEYSTRKNDPGELFDWSQIITDP